jgi:hypothetical protein
LRPPPGPHEKVARQLCEQAGENPDAVLIWEGERPFRIQTGGGQAGIREEQIGYLLRPLDSLKALAHYHDGVRHRKINLQLSWYRIICIQGVRGRGSATTKMSSGRG